MMWWLVAGTSGFLIATGLWLVVRDGVTVAWPFASRRTGAENSATSGGEDVSVAQSEEPSANYGSTGRAVTTPVTLQRMVPPAGRRRPAVSPVMDDVEADVVITSRPAPERQVPHTVPLTAPISEALPERAGSMPRMVAPVVTTVTIAPAQMSGHRPVAAHPVGAARPMPPLQSPHPTSAIAEARSPAPAPVPTPVPTSPPSSPQPLRTPLDAINDVIDGIEAETAGRVVQSPRDDNAERRWRQAATYLQLAILGINERSRRVGLEIGPPGDPGWSPGNAGYGVYCRVLVGGQSLAWLRAELQPGARLMFKVRAHGGEHAAVNANVDAGVWPLAETSVTASLVDVVQPAVAYAAWRADQGAGVQPVVTPMQPTVSPSASMASLPFAAQPPSVSASAQASPVPPPPPPPSSPLAAEPVSAPRQSLPSAVKTKTSAWIGRVQSALKAAVPTRQGSAQHTVDDIDLIASSVKLVNSAFADVGARLSAIAPPRHLLHDTGRSGTKLGAQSGGLVGQRGFQIWLKERPAGLLVVDDGVDFIGLSVGVEDPARLSAAQRMSVPRAGAGPYEVAEAMATCVWPVLALEGAGET